jgi:hypothetical protein
MIQLFTKNPQLFDFEQIPEIKAKGVSKVEATLPLRDHSVYGKTILYINEKLDDEGNIKEYRYGWEYKQIGRKHLSKQAKHITAFDKQEHPEPPYTVSTEPFHHHHVPGDLSKRKDTNVQSLEDVIAILSDYILSGTKYNQYDNF